ncbi:predicted protein [Plenodomus lingam JN3]|uniref:Predicted protein n=1 Tax=Leptosphaeria maculans (strain JN3 / isolate v23.1.3 / race Av1-4-5-6-7-8) TaxID=985895 RepID=E4ZV06_LEPMJ|nr:predicted protein [Plenodomus lingam JN3]CBX95432.1 predicted protein [Plenodomus lingam JN3]
MAWVLFAVPKYDPYRAGRYARVSYVRVNWNEWAQHEDEDEDEDAMRGH